MPDHKWARFKRLMGAKPSKDLVETRDKKVQEALAAVKVEIDKLKEADLPRGDLQGELDTLEQKRVDALDKKGSKAQCDALEPVKNAARALAKKAVDVAAVRLACDLRVKTALPLVKAARERIAKAIEVLEKRDQDASKHDEHDAAVAERLRLALLSTNMLHRASEAEATATEAEKRAVEAEKVASAPKPEVVEEDVPEEEVSELVAAVKEATIAVNAVNAYAKTRFEELEEIGKLKETKKKVREWKSELGEFEDSDPVEDVHEIRDEAKDLKSEIDAALQDIVDSSSVESARAVVTTRIERAERAVASLPGLASPAILDEAKRELKRIDLLRTNREKLPPLEQMVDGDLLANLGVQVRQLRDAERGLRDLLTYLGTVIAKLDSGTMKDLAQEQLDKIEKDRTEVLERDDLDLDKVHEAFGPLRERADTLLKATGLRPETKEAYKEALKGRFGIDVTSDKRAWVNVEGAYNMLCKVPDSHVGHDKLKTLDFNNTWFEAGGEYGASRITIAHVPDIPYTRTMSIEGETVRVNAFNQTMLHELGHSVDDKYSIMASGSGAGFADWRRDGQDKEVGDLFVAAAVGQLLDENENTRKAVEAIIRAAFADTKPTRPVGLPVKAWQIAKAYATKIRKGLATKKPWYNAKPEEIALAGRVYHQSGSSWTSYLLAARSVTYVSDYQWKAPAEWFAEIYGLSWTAERAPPSGVDPVVASYCYGGKAPSPEV